jgi:ATP-dependent helicase/nuclease subunit B
VSQEQVLAALERGATLVTVNRRLARYYRELYDARACGQGREVWDSPDILPWGAWLARAYEEAVLCGAPPSVPLLLSEAQELALWERVIGESARGGGLLLRSATAGLALDARNIQVAWRLPVEAGDGALTEDVHAFLGWSQLFERRCREAGWLDRARLGDAVAEWWGRRVLPPPREILLAGFDELTPQQEAVLAGAAAAGAAVRQVPADPPGKACRSAFPVLDDELMAAARWARARLERDPRARVGIVVPQLAAVRERVRRTLDGVLHPHTLLPENLREQRLYNLSLGPPLSEYPVVGAALCALGVDAPSAGSGQARRVPLEELSALLRSPYLGGGDREGQRRAMLDARLRELREPEIPLSQIFSASAGGAYCPDLLSRLRGLEREHSGWPAEQPPSGWAVHFSRCLDLLGWPGDRPLSSAEYQTVLAWREQLAGLAALDAVQPRMRREAALDKLKRMTEAAIFQPEGEPVPVQVLGLLEAAGERFDALWVLGLHGDVWPAAPRPNPFLPYRLQRDHGVPHASAERELWFARRVTERLLAGAPEVIFSHPLQEGDADLRPSPLVAHIAHAAPREIPLADHVPYAELLRSAGRRESLRDAAGPPLAAGSRVPGGTALLKDQAACPFRAFAIHRLRADALEGPARGLEPLDRGILVHRALERCWTRLGDSGALLAATDDALEALCREAARTAVEEQVGRRPSVYTERFTAVEQERLAALVRQWLVLERSRAPFAVLVQERAQVADLGEIRVTARADRIDRLPDGTIAIIDYKTGRPSVQSWDGDRPDEPQIPLYAVASGEAPRAVMFARVRKGEMAFLGLGTADIASGIERVAPETLAELLAGWRRALTALAAEVVAGHAPVAPKEAKTCQYCNLGALCRIAEVQPDRRFPAGEADP